MRIAVLTFTNKGTELARCLSGSLDMHDIDIYQRGSDRGAVIQKAFRDREPLVFIGAAGIAVRMIAPFVKDKLTDPPVTVIDEAGSFVIPVLSGHMGGANELSLEIAEALGALPVITTATDVSRAFSVDMFSKENGLGIVNRDGIARVSSAALEGKPVTICIKDYPPEEHVDVLISDSPHFRDMAAIFLCPKRYAIGIGCRKGKAYEDIRTFAERVLKEKGIDIRDIGCIATIDIKKDEEGLKSLSQAWSVPLITFDAKLLAKAKGEFSSSEKVLEVTGVDNVCERAAVIAAGRGSELIIRKTAENGITVALAKAAGSAGESGSAVMSAGSDPASKCIPAEQSKAAGSGSITVIGMGPGKESMMTQQALDALEEADVIVGYNAYLELLADRFRQKEMLSTPMKQEAERCRMCFREAAKGKAAAMVCSGDAGIYGMASLMFEIREELRDAASDTEIRVIPGITAASSGAAVLGAPLNHDFCVISLSDLLTPWELIEKRLMAAAEGDFAIAIYNPSSHKRHDYLKKACDILLRSIDGSRACGYVRNIGRDGEEYSTCTLAELRDAETDMFTTVFIGNSKSRITDGRLITPRGYRL